MATTNDKVKGEARQAPQSEGPGSIAKFVVRATKVLQATKANKSLLDEAMDRLRLEEGPNKLQWAKLHQSLNDAKEKYLAGKNNAHTFYQLYKELNAALDSAGTDLLQPPRTRYELMGWYLDLACDSKKSAGRQKDNEKLEIYLYALHAIKSDRENSGAGGTLDRFPAAEIAKRAHAMGLTETKHEVRAVRAFLASRGFSKKLIK